jgi:Fe-S cluster assembly protein SufD
MGLETIVDEEKYESVLFDISRSLDNKQKIITINKNIAEPIFLIHKLKENETIFSNSLKIKVAKDIKASVVEVFVNSCLNSFYAVNRKIELEENACLEYAKIQDINSSNSMIFSLAVNQKNSSNLEISNFEYGDGFVVNSFENILNRRICKL